MFVYVVHVSGDWFLFNFNLVKYNYVIYISFVVDYLIYLLLVLSSWFDCWFHWFWCWKLAANKYRINQEIKILYCKKQKLNERLYHVHLECAMYWNVTWQYIQTTINVQLDRMMDPIYHRFNKKLDAIQKHGTYNKNAMITTKHTFCASLVDLIQNLARIK